MISAFASLLALAGTVCGGTTVWDGEPSVHIRQEASGETIVLAGSFNPFTTVADFDKCERSNFLPWSVIINYCLRRVLVQRGRNLPMGKYVGTFRMAL